MTGKHLGKILLQGLVAMLPALLTLYILYWLVWSAETVLGEVFSMCCCRQGGTSPAWDCWRA
jgi:uncharacterized membrane protein